jgi:hypothetical protein
MKCLFLSRVLRQVLFIFLCICSDDGAITNLILNTLRGLKAAMTTQAIIVAYRYISKAICGLPRHCHFPRPSLLERGAEMIGLGSERKSYSNKGHKMDSAC